MEKYFRDKKFKELYINSINNCKEQLKNVIQQHSPLYNFTDHTLTHSQRIELRLINLYTELFEGNNSEIYLNDAEIYILIMSIYLHDIGMELMKGDLLINLFQERKYRNKFIQSLVDRITVEDIEKAKKNDADFYDFIRKNHHIISALWIMRSQEKSEFSLPILDGYANYIALVCFAHNEDVDILKEPYYGKTFYHDNTIELKVLAYLLRIGDALDGDRSRVNMEVKNIKDIPVISRIHWYRHYFTKSILCQERNISIIFEFPEADDLEQEIEQYFIDQTKKWLDVNIDDLLKRKVLESSIRNKYLKCTVYIEEPTYGFISSIDEDVKNKIKEEIVQDKTVSIITKKKDYVVQMINQFNEELIENKYDATLQKTMKDIFIQPKIFSYPEGEKDDSVINDKRIEMKHILNCQDNYAFIGRENIGKTTLLRYIFYELQNTNKIPFIMDYHEIRKTSTDLIYKLIRGQGVVQFGEDISELIKDGNIVLLIDNVDIYEEKYFKNIKYFIDNYSNNKVIITSTENEENKIYAFERGLKKEKILEKFKINYLHCFGMEELKIMINRWVTTGKLKNEFNVLQSMKKLLFNNKLPRTPLVYSLFIGILESDMNILDMGTINMYLLLDKFSDVYLGKYSIWDNRAEYINYNVKDYMLQLMANYFVTHTKRSIDIKEYLEFIDEFNKDRDTEYDAIKLIEELKKSKLINCKKNQIEFTFDCFLYYFYVKYVNRNNEGEKLLEKIPYQAYNDIITLYASQVMDAEDVVIECMTYLINEIDIPLKSVLYDINQVYDSLKVTGNITLEEKKKDNKEIESEVNTIKKTERMIERSYDELPRKSMSDRKNGMFGATLLLSEVLKESEMIKKDCKKEAVQYCLEAYCIIFKKLCENLDKYIADKKKEDNSIDEMKLKYELVTMLTFIVQEIAVQYLASYNLNTTIDKLYNEIEYEFGRFILISLKIELEGRGVKELAEEFIDQCNNEVLLQCLFINLQGTFVEKSMTLQAEAIRLSLIKSLIDKLYSPTSVGRNQVYIKINTIDTHIQNLMNRRKVYQKTLTTGNVSK